MKKLFYFFEKIRIQKPLFQKIYIIGIVFSFLFLFVTQIQTSAQESAPLQDQVNNQRFTTTTNKTAVIATEWIELISGNPNSPDKKGAIGYTLDLIETLYKYQPASTSEYVKFLAEKFQPESVYAAQNSNDQGFGMLTPLQDLWKQSLGLSLFFLTILVLAIGFMIMFRKRINPQTVANVQDSIPRLIAVLLLIYFSYAIVGVLVDLSRFAANLVIAFFGSKAGGSGIANMANKSPFQIFFDWTGQFQPITAMIKNLVESTLPLKDYQETFKKAGVDIIANLIGVIGSLFILFTILITLLKVFFALLSSYVSIVLYTIVAPIQLALGVLPGQNKFITGWFKSILANVLVFPATFAILALASYFSGTTTANPSWTPPLLNIKEINLNLLIALGLIIMSPKVPDMVKGAFGEEGGLGGVGQAGLGAIPFLGGYAKGDRK